MKLPKIKLGKLLRGVVKVAAPIVVGAIAAKAQGKAEKGLGDLLKKIGK